jgi:hypothetical protein
MLRSESDNGRQIPTTTLNVSHKCPVVLPACGYTATSVVPTRTRPQAARLLHHSVSISVGSVAVPCGVISRIETILCACVTVRSAITRHSHDLAYLSRFIRLASLFLLLPTVPGAQDTAGS